MQVAVDEVQTSEDLLGDPWAGIEHTGEAHCAMWKALYSQENFRGLFLGIPSIGL